ncbi:MAG: hypothetical protein O2892_19955, partial [Actinomycetota bacterium]|nr:hypothetical protein [Actinomycetota bacterium]MDA2951277.1 hypothetical protein [Actinomycetota bacterium]
MNGLGEKTAASAYAYAVPGLLFTYNTTGDPGKVRVAFNGFDMWTRAAATGADLLWRVKST